MDDLTLRYYDAEMRYLLEAGEEFARAHPEQAAMLNLDKAGARDPYVERLFEGFAFLMGRLREKLDDDLPELTEGLVSLLWPHYLRTIPSMSVVEFTPEWREMKEPMRIVKGFEVNSRPIGEKGTRCRYTTTKEITLQPLSLEHARLSTDPDGRSVINLRFNCSHLADWSRVDLSQLPFYFNADAPLACAMHEAFTMNTARLWLRMSPYCLRPVEVSHPLGFYGDDDFLLDGNTPLGDEAMDANSQLLVALSTDNEQEAQGWKPDGLLYQDFLVMLRVYLGWRFKAKITLTTATRLLAPPPLGEGPFWLGMNGVLGAEGEDLPADIPQTFTTELGYYTGLQPATPQQGNRRVTYKFN